MRCNVLKEDIHRQLGVGTVIWKERARDGDKDKRAIEEII